jgi:hypothetical protein
MFWTKRKSVDELTNDFSRTNDIRGFEQGLRRLDPASLPADQREAWHHMWGVAAYRANNHAEAMRRFEQGMVAVPTSGLIAFSLGQEYEYIGDANRAFGIFDRFTYPAVPAAFALAQARYAYLWGEPARGTAYVLPIFETYFKLGIADDHFLYMRGLPFFGQTWAYVAAFGELERDLVRLKQLTTASTAKLTDYDFGWAEIFIAALESGGFRPIVQRLRTRMTAEAKSRGPSGYLAMQAATIQALEIDQVPRSSEIAAVAIAESDFPWLNDVRVAALAALALRSGDTHAFGRHSRAFMAQQPMLLEPDHAFNFRLLEYQEKLKSRYQQGRRRNAG